MKATADNRAEGSRPEAALRVVIAYDHVADGRRAMDLLAGLSHACGDTVRFDPIPWSFDLLSDWDWREVAASDAVRADLLILATSSELPLPAAVARWAEDTIARKRGRAEAVVALFGAPERPDRSHSTRLTAIRQAAEEAGLAFFAPTPPDERNAVMAAIHLRANLLTPQAEGPEVREPAFKG